VLFLCINARTPLALAVTEFSDLVVVDYPLQLAYENNVVSYMMILLYTVVIYNLYRLQ